MKFCNIDLGELNKNETDFTNEVKSLLNDKSVELDFEKVESTNNHFITRSVANKKIVIFYPIKCKQTLLHECAHARQKLLGYPQLKDTRKHLLPLPSEKDIAGHLTSVILDVDANIYLHNRDIKLTKFAQEAKGNINNLLDQLYNYTCPVKDLHWCPLKSLVSNISDIVLFGQCDSEIEEFLELFKEKFPDVYEYYNRNIKYFIDDKRQPTRQEIEQIFEDLINYYPFLTLDYSSKYY